MDWSGAAHEFTVPLERVLFAPIQWLYAREVRQCCVATNCADMRDVVVKPPPGAVLSCIVRRDSGAGNHSYGLWESLRRVLPGAPPGARPAESCCPHTVTLGPSGAGGASLVRAKWSVPPTATDVQEARAALSARESVKLFRRPSGAASCSVAPERIRRHLSSGSMGSFVGISNDALAQVDHGCPRCPACEPGAHCAAGCKQPAAPRAHRAVLCIFGVVGRGITHTWPTMRQEVMERMRAHGLQTDVYVFNMDTGGAPVDGNVVANQSDLQVVPATVLESQIQREADRDIAVQCAAMPPNHQCAFSYYPTSHKVPYTSPKKLATAVSERRHLNAMRQLYSERAVGRFLQHTQYDVAVVCSSDLYLALPLHMPDIWSAISLPNVLWTTAINDAGLREKTGFTDGFYIGQPESLSKVLRRLDESALWSLPSPYDYEVFLRRAFDHHGLVRKVTPMVFFKVRANKVIEYYRWNRSATSVADRVRVDHVYKELHAHLTRVQESHGTG